MNVLRESNRSVKSTATMEGQSAGASAPQTSRRSVTAVKSGRLTHVAGGVTRPNAHARPVTAVMLARKAIALPRTIRATAIISPSTVRSTCGVNGPGFTRVTGSATMMPPPLSPTSVISRPMPHAMAVRSDGGIAVASRSRSGVPEIARNSTPAQNTMPSAVGHGTCSPTTIVYAKKAFRPMPGATANGSRAYTPMRMVSRAHSSTVAVSTPSNGMPVPSLRIAGLTTTM